MPARHARGTVGERPGREGETERGGDRETEECWQSCPSLAVLLVVGSLARGTPEARSETGHNSENRPRTSHQRWQPWQPRKCLEGAIVKRRCRCIPLRSAKPLAEKVCDPAAVKLRRTRSHFTLTRSASEVLSPFSRSSLALRVGVRHLRTWFGEALPAAASPPKQKGGSRCAPPRAADDQKTRRRARRDHDGPRPSGRQARRRHACRLDRTREGGPSPSRKRHHRHQPGPVRQLQGQAGEGQKRRARRFCRRGRALPWEAPTRYAAEEHQHHTNYGDTSLPSGVFFVEAEVGPASVRAAAHQERPGLGWAGARKLAGPTLRRTGAYRPNTTAIRCQWVPFQNRRWQRPQR